MSDIYSIMMLFDAYFSKVIEDNGMMIYHSKFKLSYMKNIDLNINIINKIIFNDYKEVSYVDIWMRMP